MEAFDIVEGDGGAFSIMGRVRHAMKQAGMQSEITAYVNRATAGDYSNLLEVSMEYAERAAEVLGDDYLG